MKQTNVWPKTHACGASFTEDQWETLPYVGVQFGNEKLDLLDLELRLCTCQSTIAIVCPTDIHLVTTKK